MHYYKEEGGKFNVYAYMPNERKDGIESVQETREAAMARVSYLNGGIAPEALKSMMETNQALAAKIIGE